MLVVVFFFLMIRRPPRSTQSRSSAASDVYKRQILLCFTGAMYPAIDLTAGEKERGTMETLLCSPVSLSLIHISEPTRPY